MLTAAHRSCAILTFRVAAPVTPSVQSRCRHRRIGRARTLACGCREAATERGTEAAAPRDATMQAQDRLDSKGRSSGGEEAGPKGTDTPETNDNTEIAPATPDRDARPAGPSGRAEGGDKAFREGGEGRLAKQGVKVKVGGEGGVGAGKGEEGDEDGASEAGSDRLRAFGKRDEKDVLAVSGEEPVAVSRVSVMPDSMLTRCCRNRNRGQKHQSLALESGFMKGRGFFAIASALAAGAARRSHMPTPAHPLGPTRRPAPGGSARSRRC